MTIGHNQVTTATRTLEEALDSAYKALEAIDCGRSIETTRRHVKNAADAISGFKKMFDQAMDLSRKEEAPVLAEKQADWDKD